MAPLAAIASAQQLLRQAEEAVRACVDRARRDGHTWQEIGNILGISRQAAFQRFGRPAESGSGAAVEAMVVGDAADRATALVVDLVAQRWTEVCRDFDERMVAAVPPAMLQDLWAQLSATIGGYERMGTPFARQLGGYSTVDVPLYFEAGDMVAQVSFDRSARVAGLRLLPVTAA